MVVAHPVHHRAGCQSCASRGVAAARAEAEKLRAYAVNPGGQPVHIVPLAFESYGRWDKAAEQELKLVARRQVLSDPDSALVPGAAVSALLSRWRPEVFVTLLRGNFFVVEAAVGGGLRATGATPRLRPELWEVAV